MMPWWPTWRPSLPVKYLEWGRNAAVWQCTASKKVWIPTNFFFKLYLFMFFDCCENLCTLVHFLFWKQFFFFFDFITYFSIAVSTLYNSTDVIWAAILDWKGADGILRIHQVKKETPPINLLTHSPYEKVCIPLSLSLFHTHTIW